jgi:hypothetical protein
MWSQMLSLSNFKDPLEIVEIIIINGGSSSNHKPSQLILFLLLPKIGSELKELQNLLEETLIWM